MPDTLYNPSDDAQFFLDSLPPGLKSQLEQELHQHKTSNDYGIWPAITVFTFFILYGYFAIRRVLKAPEPASERILLIPPKNCYVYKGAHLGLNDGEIIKILEKYFPYYMHLNPELQKRFFIRLREFMNEKFFIIRDENAFKEMPVLVSAAAIQLTFGFKRFKLPHYQYIQIRSKEYFADDALRVLAGDVKGNIITVAWNQLLNGFENWQDGVNVGLHEMAHALYYQHLVADVFRYSSFNLKYNRFISECKEKYVAEMKIKKSLYSEVALNNVQEFWAESIELFFEKPLLLYTNNMEMFDALKNILHQDPTNISNPLL